MVHFKRTPITYAPHPKGLTKDSEIWEMEGTEEIFATYEEYIARLEYYRQRKFTCEISGHTNLTYFDALRSETKGAQDIDNKFPDLLREPVLRRVQFSTVSRIDDLVNNLYDIFKDDFFPGEHVTVRTVEFPDRREGVIREKTVVNETRRLDGTIVREASSSYGVAVGDPPVDLYVDHKNVSRDRRSFTKHGLRSFLKNSITRDRWEGAPWIVKEHLSKRYGIDTVVPEELRQEHVQAGRKATQALKKQEDGIKKFFKPGNKDDTMAKNLAAALSGNRKAQADRYQYQISQPFNNGVPLQRMPSGTVKYPIDDLEIAPKRNAAPRPSLKYFESKTGGPGNCGVHERSVGSLLEIWSTLNVHAEFLLLDTFTFDDFIEAMGFTSEGVECELLTEIYCAMLKVLLTEQGTITANIPSSPDDSSEDDDDSNNAPSAESTPPPDSGNGSGKRKSNLGKYSVTADQLHRPNGHANGTRLPHRAVEYLEHFDWIQELEKQSYKTGGWQSIIVGILDRMSLLPYFKDKCDKLLVHLVPADRKPSQESIRHNFAKMDINARASALEIVTMLAITTERMKKYNEERNENMTGLRKKKIDFQKQRKPFIEELRALDEQRKLLRPDDVHEAHEDETNGILEEAVSDTEHESDNASGKQLSEDESMTRGRRVSGRASDKKRKRAEDARKEAVKKAKLEAATSAKQANQYNKVLKDIDKKKKQIKTCEEEVAVIDDLLRERACHRIKLLGRDRFWNRYFWFERNGMHLTGDPNSSTSSRGYANGRLWVQGPGDAEREGFIDLPQEEQAQYLAALGVTTHDRRELEEGPTHLLNAYQWAYFDDSDTLDRLISWLDDRGKREKDLRKELQLWRDKIAVCLDARNKYVAEQAARTASAEANSRVATRKKAYVDQYTTKFPCLAWRNTRALDALGQLHVDGPVPKKIKKIARARDLEAAPERSTRQGTRYGGR